MMGSLEVSVAEGRGRWKRYISSLVRMSKGLMGDSGYGPLAQSSIRMSDSGVPADACLIELFLRNKAV